MLNIVLVEPEIPQNAGNIARTCACTGSRLHLIEPMGFRPTEKNLKRAGCNYWNDVDIVRWPYLGAFLEAHGEDELHLFTGAVSRTYAEVAYGWMPTSSSASPMSACAVPWAPGSTRSTFRTRWPSPPTRPCVSRISPAFPEMPRSRATRCARRSAPAASELIR